MALQHFTQPLYWLENVACGVIKVSKWLPLSEIRPVDYDSCYTKSFTGLFTEKEIKNVRGFFCYARHAEKDAVVAEIILALQVFFFGKTIVIYTEMAEEQRQFYKVSTYEDCAHVPFLMMGPGIKSNLQVPNVVSFGNIYPTQFDICYYYWESSASGQE